MAIISLFLIKLGFLSRANFWQKARQGFIGCRVDEGSEVKRNNGCCNIHVASAEWDRKMPLLISHASFGDALKIYLHFRARWDRKCALHRLIVIARRKQLSSNILAIPKILGQGN